MAATPSSRCVLAAGPWRTVLEAMCARFPRIAGGEWQRRFAAGRVFGEDGTPYAVDSPFRAGLVVNYTREVACEPEVPGDVVIVHADARLVVADKPPGLPVMPTGPWVRQTLQYRVLEALGLQHATPLHRIDRDTAGLVLLSVDPGSRPRYQALFRDRAVRKRYEALAPPIDDGGAWPRVRRSRLVRGEPFFRMQEADGPVNSETWIDVAGREHTVWRYLLEPVTGRKHQLRVHMAALGAPLFGDALYPTPRPGAGPLALLARSLEFIDPVDGSARHFVSGRDLRPPGSRT
jgi:tRNA pseudouridine32 synthase/23S rRNA pseudouridine746 synthase